MPRRTTFRALVFTSVALFFLVTRPLFAIRPVIIMFYGGSLKQPVLLTDTMVFHDLENPTTLRVQDLSGRPHLSVAMFWGTKWNPYVSGERPLRSLTPEMASQHGRFYPATPDRPAVLLQTIPQLEQRSIPDDMSALTWGGELEPSWIGVLVSRGVPAGSPRKRR